MKKIILILSVLVAFTFCKKTTTSSPAPTPTVTAASTSTVTPTPTNIWCLFIDNNDGTKTFYKCCSTITDLQQTDIALRNSGLFTYSCQKATCSDCQ